VAVGKVSGVMLQSNLERQGVDLSIDTDLVYVDVANRRLGVNTDTPTSTITANGNVEAYNFIGNLGTSAQPYITSLGTLANLTVSGNTQLSYTTFGNVIIYENSISTLAGNLFISAADKVDLGSNTNIVISGGASGYALHTDGFGNLYWEYSSVSNVGNIAFNDTTITTVNANANIYLTADGTATVQITGNSAFGIPYGNTAQAPTTNINAGSIRYNTDLQTPEFWNGTGWVAITTAVSDQTINPNGADDTYTLDQPATASGILVVINGVMQRPDVAYTVSGTQITFTEVPLTTDIIDVRFIAPGQPAGLNLIGNAVPTTSNSSGVSGQVAYDSSYVYICVDTDTWIRANIESTF